MSNLRDDAFWDGATKTVDVTKTDGATKTVGANKTDGAGRPAGAKRPARRARGRSERVETRGRARALQALYAADLRDYTALKRIAVQLWDDLAIDPAERAFASSILSLLVEKRTEVDASLAAITANWRLERLGAIERSVLRLAAAEFLRGTTPPRVVIKEAIHLAERYGTERSARFVNGVLDAYARQIGAL